MCEQGLNYVDKVKFDQVNKIYPQRVDPQQRPLNVNENQAN